MLWSVEFAPIISFTKFINPCGVIKILFHNTLYEVSGVHTSNPPFLFFNKKLFKKEKPTDSASYRHQHLLSKLSNWQFLFWNNSINANTVKINSPATDEPPETTPANDGNNLWIKIYANFSSPCRDMLLCACLLYQCSSGTPWCLTCMSCSVSISWAAHSPWAAHREVAKTPCLIPCSKSC